MPTVFNFQCSIFNAQFTSSRGKTAHQLSSKKNAILTHQKGQVLMDIVIATGLFVILVHAIFSLVIVIYETMGYSRVRLTARNLANEKMEQLVNLTYADLGTTTGVPHGIVPEFETVTRNGNTYYIHTSITYFDDPFDKTAPLDLLPTDYKQVHMEISWDGQYQAKTAPIVLVNTVAPKGVETSAGGGTLSVFVINALGKPVSGGSVHIVNSAVTPRIDMTLQTDVNGLVMLPGAPTCATCYMVTVSKDGYSTDRTYTTIEVSNPNKRLMTVTAGQLSSMTFVIDQTSALTFHSTNDRAHTYTFYPRSKFRLTGSKTIGTDVDGDPVYKYDQSFSTNNQGDYTIPNLEWDTYMLTIPSSENLDIAGINPDRPLAINPGQNTTLNYAVTPHTPNSLFLSVKNASSSAIASVSATLKLTPSFIATSSSGLSGKPDVGQVFFSGLNPGSYTYTLTHPDYKTTTGNVIVNGTSLEKAVMDEK